MWRRSLVVKLDLSFMNKFICLPKGWSENPVLLPERTRRSPEWPDTTPSGPWDVQYIQPRPWSYLTGIRVNVNNLLGGSATNLKFGVSLERGTVLGLGRRRRGWAVDAA